MSEFRSQRHAYNRKFISQSVSFKTLGFIYDCRLNCGYAADGYARKKGVGAMVGNMTMFALVGNMTMFALGRPAGPQGSLSDEACAVVSDRPQIVLRVHRW